MAMMAMMEVAELATDAERCRAAETTTDAPDRTSSEDEHNPLHVVAGLPPIAPVKAATKASVVSEAAIKPKTRKPKTPKKVAARRRKMKTSKAAGISQASAVKLFQCSCQLLRTQTLDYDVRAREMEDRNAALTKEINEWEKRIRSLKRELEEYVDEQPRSETTAMTLMEGTPAVRALDEPSTLLTTATPESSLPIAVVGVEVKLQEELRKRTHKVNEFCRSVPGFIESLDDQIRHQL